MAIDPNIPLQAKAPDVMGQMGQMLGVAQGAQNLQASRYQLQQEQLQHVQNDFNSIAQDPDISEAANNPDPKKRQEAGKRVIDKLKTHAEFARQAGIPAPVVQNALSQYITTAALHPEQLQQLIAQRQQAGIGAGGQVAQTQIPVGAQQAAAGTDISGRPITQYKTQFGQMGMGPTQTAGNMQVAPALGQPQAVAGNQEIALKDWENTTAQAGNASRNIGVLQNIRQLSKGAVTGVANERRQFINGLAGLIGLDSAELEKTNTDLLAKNSNMLALAGGNTDAARALAEGANPNTHMTPEAIRHAVDQVISQQELALKKQKFFGKHALNMQFDKGQGYMNALQQWNDIADPRILQFKNMSPQERTDMKKSMPKNEQAEFARKLQEADRLGILK